MKILLAQMIASLVFTSFILSRLEEQCTYHELHHVVPYKHIAKVIVLLNSLSIILIFILIWSF